MKLQQLRYLAAVVQNGLNVTTAAQSLHTSQPGVSKQIRLLEEELGLTLFVRDGRALKRLTPAGEEVAARALRRTQDARDSRHAGAGTRHADPTIAARSHRSARSQRGRGIREPVRK